MTFVPHPVAAIVTALGSISTHVVAQVSGAGGDLGPWVQGGSAVLAVGALAYIARLLAGGKLVAVDTAARDAELLKIIERGERREAESERRAKAAMEREDRMWTWLQSGRAGQPPQRPSD